MIANIGFSNGVACNCTIRSMMMTRFVSKAGCYLFSKLKVEICVGSLLPIEVRMFSLRQIQVFEDMKSVFGRPANTYTSAEFRRLLFIPKVDFEATYHSYLSQNALVKVKFFMKNLLNAIHLNVVKSFIISLITVAKAIGRPSNFL